MSKRTLEQWLSYLEGLHPSAIDMGLERSAKVFRQLGLARPAPKVITVTGTNGKGSSCAFLAQMLRAQGLSVGMYNSPHLLTYNERVNLNGVLATDTQLCAAFEAVEAARGDVSLTYFEMGTLAAFWLFEQAKLDAVVLEVGLGGRLDAVNLVDADLALITSIGIDHSDWLGNTRESVAFEKAGIMRQNRPAVCGDIDPPITLLERAAALQAPLYVRDQQFSLSIKANSWDWRGTDARGKAIELNDLELLSLPMVNAAAALQAYALLDLPWDGAVLKQALLNTSVVGRLDRRTIRYAGKTLNLLLDVGHNPQAAAFLATQLKRFAPSGKRLAVFGLLSDKELAGVIEPLQDVFASWCVAPLPTPRSRSAQELSEALHARGLVVSEAADIGQALAKQCATAHENDLLVVFGSFYCVAQALSWLASNTSGE